MRSSLLLRLAAAVVLAVPAAAQTVLFSEDFESGYSRWTMTDLWHGQDASGPCTQAAVPFPSGTHCVWYGDPGFCTFDTGNWDFQHLTCTQSIDLPESNGVFELRFRSLSAGEDDGVWDTRKPEISTNGGATWTPLVTVLSSSTWLQERYDISRYAGQSIRLRFSFWIGDWSANGYLGWLIDDIQVVEQPGPAVEQCYGDGTWYGCPCNNLGAPGRGCASSFHPAGARLSASGEARLGADTLTFTADGMSQAVATIFQGVGFNHGYWTTIAGDGLTCVGSPYVRIRSVPTPGGSVVYPSAGYPAISISGAIPGPWTTRTYAVRYRNAAAFCTAATFNMTNTLQVTWRP